MLQKTLIILFAFFMLTSCNKKQTAVSPNIIPQPHQMELIDGAFTLSGNTSLAVDDDFKEVAQLFNEYISQGIGQTLSIVPSSEQHQIRFKKDPSIKNDEGYRLEITPQHIQVSAKQVQGAFYAFQTLRQLFPTAFENSSYKDSQVALQCLSIEDQPQFTYRGMHLDVGRHFFSVAFIKKYIDLLAMLKMNTFHWHLTEDQGWRIEIKKYPRLQTVAAYRKETLVGHYNDQPHQFDGKRYGGFYTQEEVKDIVAYAQQRQITVIPEIEMPGHSQAAIAAYPELGCSGKPVEVATKWGIFEEVYCPNQKTFAFLEDVLDEVIPLFPGKYIHIGGDETPKIRWKNCHRCQTLMKKEGLKDEHALQSYFITRMEKYINSKGKSIIGWDEILEGGLAPNATVMSWRGTKGAIEAAKQKHNVILSPLSHCYFDYYQSDNDNEPLAIGGLIPLKRVYHFNPIPEELNGEEANYVLGAQGNVWTEYIPTAEHVEYMIFPRAIALSEAIWSKQKNYPDFIKRLESFNQRLDVMGVNYANHIYEVEGTIENAHQQLALKLSTLTAKKDIRYTMDGSEPIANSTLYKEAIKLSGNLNIKAAVFDRQEKLGNDFELTFNHHKAVGKAIELQPNPHKAYSAGGKQALINGIQGNNKRLGDMEWLGFWGDDVRIDIDLGEPTVINKISTRFYNANGQWIYAPKALEITFDDGEQITKEINPEGLITAFTLDIPQVKTQRIQLKVKKYGTIPEGFQGAGNQAWTFLDEIIVE